MDELKKKVEALLFSSGKSMSFDEIKRLCRIGNDEQLKKALQDLKVDYNNRDSSLILVNEGDRWKITTKEGYFNVVKKIVTETELSKTLMETLAVIAWKYPIKQSDLIKVRTNKAYDHLRELESMGYISRQKHGRTKLIKLTDKFFSYFDLPPDKLKEKFSDFNQIANAISNKEKEIEDMKQDHKKEVAEAKKMQKEHEEEQKKELQEKEKEIELLDKQGHKVKLKEYEESPETKIIKEPVLEAYGSEAEKPETEQKQKKEPKKEEKKESESKEKKTTKEIIDEKSDELVEELLNSNKKDKV